MSFNSDNMEQLAKDYEKISKKTNDKNKIIQHLLQKGYEYSDIKKILNTTIYEE
jgi:SOS response regulatory protein OraA/RecX